MVMTQKKSEWLVTGSLLLAAVIWGSALVALKLAFQTYDPMVVIFSQMAVASLCFLFFINRFRGIRYQKGDVGYIFLLAFFEPCLYFLFEAWALENTTASQAGMIMSLLPFIVAIAAFFFLKEYVTPKILAGFLVSALGACWLSMDAEASQHAPNPLLGNCLEFIAVICGAGYTIMLKFLTKRYSPFFLTGIQTFIGTVFFACFLFLPSTTLPVRFELIPVLSIVYLGIFTTLAAYALFSYGVSRVSSAQASVFLNLIPVFTIFLGWLILGETFTLPQYGACLLVFAGVFISQSKKRMTVRKQSADGAVA